MWNTTRKALLTLAVLTSVMATQTALAANCVTAQDIEDLPPGEWCQVPNSHLDDHKPSPLPPGDFDDIIIAWNGGAYDDNRDRFIIWGGGHADYAGNELYVFDMNSLKWTRVTEPSQGNLSAPHASGRDELYPDGLPRSRHTYNHIQFLPNVDRFFAFGACCHYPGGMTGSREISTYDFNANDTDGWESGVRQNRPSLGISTSMVTAYDPVTGKLWLNTMQSGGTLFSYDPVADSWATHATRPFVYYKTADIDSVRHRLVLTGEDGKTFYYDLDNPNQQPVQVSTTGNRNMETAQAPGFVYDSANDQFVSWNGGSSVYILNPETWNWTRISPAAGNTTIPTAAQSRGTYGRFRYVASKNVFVAVNSTEENVFIYKLSENTSDTLPSGALSATPSTIDIGQSSTLSWTINNAINCTASDGWSGSRPVSGSEVVTPSITTTYTLECSNNFGGITRSALVTVENAALDPPEVTLNSSASIINNGESLTLTWSSTGAESCTASGDWSGAVLVNGSQEVSPTSDASYTLTCSNANGVTDSATLNVTVNSDVPQLPVVTIDSDLTELDEGQSALITWTSTNANVCTASGAWSGTQPTTGSVAVSPTDTSTYTITCENADGAGEDSVTITVTSTPVDEEPMLVLQTSSTLINLSESVTLSWTTQNVSRCSAAGGWSGSKDPTGGSEVITPANTAIYQLTCNNSTGQQVLSTVVVAVEDTPPPPVIDLQVNTDEVSSGESVSLTWQVENATSCVGIGAWDQALSPTGGSYESEPLFSNAVFILSCVGDGGESAQSITVSVVEDTTPAPQVTLVATPNPVIQGGSTTLTWMTTDATSCEASGGDWSGIQPTVSPPGGVVQTNLLLDVSYTLTCIGDGGQSAAVVNVSIDTVDQNDTDSDGLPDAWELDNFGNLDATPSGDPDGDGRTNLEEYEAGSNPLIADNAAPPMPPIVEAPSDDSSSSSGGSGSAGILTLLLLSLVRCRRRASA